MPDDATALAPLVRLLFDGTIPMRLVAWDGSTVGPDPVDAREGAPAPPTIEVRSRDALLRLLAAPGELGLARAYVAGDLALGEDTSIFDLLALRDRLEADAGRPGGGLSLGVKALPTLVSALRASGTRLRLLPPPETESRPTGRLHSLRRDAQAVRHHYDVGNDFYRLVLGPSLTYSCAHWSEGVDDLAEAQAAKHELICRKLGLTEGARVLDVGCGWGSFLLHAARHHGALGVGVTLSAQQAALARRRVHEAGLSDRIDIRVEDYRDLDDEPFDAISSVGMFEHVGDAAAAATYVAALHDLLAPGGRLLNHAISRPSPDEDAALANRSFMARYVFPDAALHEVGRVVSMVQGAGLEVRDVESLREHYARTLRAWVTNLEADWSQAERLAGPDRARVWRLYMAGSALGFEANRLSVHQVLAVRPHADGTSGMPATRDWLASTGRRSEDAP